MSEEINACKNIVILVSPGPVDAYPPVQYQARILASSGYKVFVISTTFEQRGIPFSAEGVVVTRSRLSYSYRLLSHIAKAHFALKLMWRRWLAGKQLVAEIAYDPEGLFYSEICPLKPSFRIAHLHEILFDPMGRFYERLSVAWLPKFDLVVVADSNRGNLLAGQIKLRSNPIAVPNYPLLPETNSPVESKLSESDASFRVVFHGNLGFTQALDSVIRSIGKWPINVTLHLFGRPCTPDGLKLQQLVQDLGFSDRVVFEGWKDLQYIERCLPNFDIGLSLLRPNGMNLIYSRGASNKRYQYMQAGIPQISDNGFEIAELIEDNAVGICVDPDCLESISRAVCFLIKKPEERRRLGGNGRQLFLEKFNYQTSFMQVLDRIENRRKDLFLNKI